MLECCREVAQGKEGTCWKKHGQATLAVDGVRPPYPAAAIGTPPAFQPGLSGSCSDLMFKLKKSVGNTKKTDCSSSAALGASREANGQTGVDSIPTAWLGLSGFPDLVRPPPQSTTHDSRRSPWPNLNPGTLVP